MRRALMMLLAVGLSAGLTGCMHNRMCRPTCGQGTTCMTPETCQSCSADACAEPAGCGAACGQGCDPYGCGAYACGPRVRNPEARGMFNPGPPTGAVTYPYYTVRGPRDFLAGDLRPLGP